MNRKTRSLTPLRQNFFALLREVEANHAGHLVLGESLRLRDDPVRLGQNPHLGFATEDALQGDKLHIQNFGLLGPNGALPLHLTEHAHARIHHHGDHTFSEFLDIFHHRAYSLFYRAWANGQPHVGFHRPEHNRFTRQLAALVGHGSATSWGRESLPAVHRMGMAAHFTRHSKTSEGLAKVVAAASGLPVRVNQFQGQWLRVAPTRPMPALGKGLMLGRRAWDVQAKVAVELGPMGFAQYLALGPQQPARQQLFDSSFAYLGLEFDCEFHCLIEGVDVPVAQLGPNASADLPSHLCKGASLGRTAWLGGWNKAKPAQVRIRRPIESEASFSRRQP